jgi:protein N-terminal methyltransferase
MVCWNPAPEKHRQYNGRNKAGMLGGFESISRTDIQGSKSFFAKLKLPRGTPPLRIADCGAGFGPLPLGLLLSIYCESCEWRLRDGEESRIGRVTGHFLSKISGGVVVDIVEPVAKFTDEILRADNFVDEKAAGKIGRIFNVGLEEWVPEDGAYWLIWK